MADTRLLLLAAVLGMLLVQTFREQIPRRNKLKRARISTRSQAPAVLWASGRRMPLNRVGVDELRLLPGIGSKIATRIVNWRRRNGGFRSLEQLRLVKGIGKRRLATMRKYLQLSYRR